MIRIVVHRLRTIGRVVRHFANRQRWFLIPLLLVLLLTGALLIATGGLSYVAPFVYSIF
jgi:F0F1-type ATP synthase assembly protein I